MKRLKKIEKIHKKCWINLWRRTVCFPPVGEIDLHTMDSMLFLRFDRLGDMVISTPLFRIIKRHYPHIQIGVVATPTNYRVIETNTNVDHIYIYDKRHPITVLKMMKTIRNIKYNVVVNLVFSSSLTGALLSYFAAPKSSIRIRGTTGDDKDFLYNVNIRKKIWGAATKTMLEETVDMLRVVGIHVQDEDIRPDLYIPAHLRAIAQNLVEKRNIKIGINLSAGHETREWSIEKYDQFIRQCAARIRPSTMLLFSMPNSQRLTELLHRELPGNAKAIPTSFDILEIAAYLSFLDVLLTPDTSFVHIASALRIPLVGLYSTREKATLWAPYNIPNRMIIAENHQIKDIPVDRVLSETLHLLKELNKLS